jgi:hypothetical protein
MICGEGYDADSAGCTSCLKGYFPSLQLCEACPATKAGVVVHVLAILVFLIGFACCGLYFVHSVARRRGISVWKAVPHCKDFVKWALITWQVGTVLLPALAAAIVCEFA